MSKASDGTGLPYQYATTGSNAVDEMRRVLSAFGAEDFGIMENFSTGDLKAQFTYKGIPVTIEASAQGYAAAWLRHNPHSNKMKRTRIEHEQQARKQASIAVYSILRDWIKGQITAIEIGMMSFEGAFLGQILLPNGNSVLDAVKKNNLLPTPDDDA